MVSTAAVLSACRPDAPQPVTGFVSASVVEDAGELVAGTRATGRVGDFRLANDFIEVVISSGTGGFDPWAGAVLDADVVREVHADRLGEVFPTVSRAVVAAADGEVTADGSDERAATLRFEGPLRPFPGTGAETAPDDVTAVTEYTIRPETRWIEIRTTVTNAGSGSVELDVGDALWLGADQDVFSAGEADDPNWIIAAGPDVAYGWLPGDLQLSQEEESITVTAATVTLAPGASASVERKLFVGTTAGEVTTDIHATLGVPTGTLIGFLRDLAGDIAEDATLDVRASDGRLVTRLRPDTSGAFAARVPPDTVGLTASSPSRGGAADPLFVKVATDKNSNVIILMPATGLVQFRAVDAGTADPIPAKLTLYRNGQRVAEAVSNGEPSAARALPGEYLAVVSRGPEWTRVESTVQVGAGQTVPATAAGANVFLERVLDTTDRLAVEPRFRTSVSVEGSREAEALAKRLAAEGIEASFSGERDRWASPDSVSNDLQIDPGLEVVAEGYGRFGFLGADDPEASGSALWLDETTGDVRSADEITAGLSGLVVVRDPRGSPGYLDSVGFDPADGSSTEPLADFDLLEVSDPAGPAFADWLALVSSGRPVTAVAGSTDVPGYPRTLAGTDVTTSLTAQDAVVSSGVVVDVVATAGAQSAGIGQTLDASATGCSVSLQVHAESPAWASFKRVRVFENVSEDSVQTISPALEGQRFTADVVVPVAPGSDAVYVVVVEGDGTLFPVADAPVFAIANPVYVDCLGDGWEAPL